MVQQRIIHHAVLLRLIYLYSFLFQSLLTVIIQMTTARRFSFLRRIARFVVWWLLDRQSICLVFIVFKWTDVSTLNRLFMITHSFLLPKFSSSILEPNLSNPKNRNLKLLFLVDRIDNHNKWRLCYIIRKVSTRAFHLERLALKKNNSFVIENI